MSSVSGGDEFESDVVTASSDGRTALMTGRVKCGERPIWLTSDAVVTEWLDVRGRVALPERAAKPVCWGYINRPFNRCLKRDALQRRFG